jgi:hypothetical protein
MTALRGGDCSRPYKHHIEVVDGLELGRSMRAPSDGTR